MKTARFAASAFATVALTLTACGGGESEAEPRSSGDGWETPVDGEPQTSEPTTEPSTEPVEDIPWPCSLVPPEVVGEIYGSEVTVEWEKPFADGASLQCNYNTGSSLVTFFVNDMTSFPGTPASAEEALQLASGGSALAVIEGVGELAGYKDGPLATLYVANAKGGSFEVAFITGSPEERDQLIGIAEELAAGM